MTALAEADVEAAALEWLATLGWQTAHGPDIGPGGPNEERADYGAVALERRLRDALARLNPDLPSEALDDAFRKLTRPEGSTLEARNRAFHRMLVAGVKVEYRTDGGMIRGAQAAVIDYDDLTANDFLAVNQVTVAERDHTRRPDVVLFVNGLPLGVIELKNPADEEADIWTAWQQLQTYKAELPSLFSMNELLVVSDGTEARLGTLTAGREWFKPWRTVSGEDLAEVTALELRVLLDGVCAAERMLPLIRDFIVFEDDGSGALAKKMAGYHQFHAVRTAVAETLRAAKLGTVERVREARGRYKAGQQPGGAPGDRRIGVVWHTQGAGKSLSMAFYAGAIAREPAMENPTIVVLTDRNDLDDQLFGTFARCQDLLGQPPAQAESRADLRKKLSVASGGVVFTTIQKFYPEERGDTHPSLSSRRNIVVIADEAHRSQYDFIDGFARHMRDALPNASFVGFTGTPIERADANTRAVFGDYISIYDIQRAVLDGATVPDLLREPARQARPRRGRAPAHRRGVRGGDRGRGGRAQGAAQDPLGPTRGHRRRRAARPPRRRGHRRALRTAPRRHRGQGDGRLHESPHLHRPLPRARATAPRVGARRRRQGRDQGGDDRIRLGPAGLAAAHPQQGASRGPRQALPRRGRLAAHRPRTRHVADGVRRAEPAHDVRRQADARPRPDAGHRPRQPRVQGQARRPDRRLPRPRERAEAGSRHVHRERR